MTADIARINYLRWLSLAHPDVYAKVAGRLRFPLGTLGFIPALISAIVQVGSVVLQKKQADQQMNLQKKALAISDAQAAADRANTLKLALLDVNTKRAQAGLGPVDLNGNLIQSQSLPTPAALQTIVGGSTAGVSNSYLLIGGGALALVAVIYFARR